MFTITYFTVAGEVAHTDTFVGTYVEALAFARATHSDDLFRIERDNNEREAV